MRKPKLQQESIFNSDKRYYIIEVAFKNPTELEVIDAHRSKTQIHLQNFTLGIVSQITSVLW